LHPGLGTIRAGKLPGRFVAPGQRAGGLCAAMAQKLGLPEGTAVSAAIIDAHAGVPGAGVGEAATLVMVMGTSGCHMLLGTVERRGAGGGGGAGGGSAAGGCGDRAGRGGEGAVRGARHGPGLGAAMLGALAAGQFAGGYDDVHGAVAAMAGMESRVPPARMVEPEGKWAAVYAKIYAVYRRFAEEMSR